MTIPSIEQEAARDLVRAREDVRGDLMSGRHRVSKLLLRQGIVYSGGTAWTGKHELWLRTHRFDTPGRQLAYDATFDAMLATVDRRDRLDVAITAMAADSAFTPVVTRLGCLRGHLHVDRVRVGRRNRRLATTERTLDRRLPRVGAHRELLGRDPLPRRGHQDRQQPCPPTAGRSGLASPTPVSTGARVAATVGDGVPCGPVTRTGSQSASVRPLGWFR